MVTVNKQQLIKYKNVKYFTVALAAMFLLMWYLGEEPTYLFWFGILVLIAQVFNNEI